MFKFFSFLDRQRQRGIIANPELLHEKDQHPEPDAGNVYNNSRYIDSGEAQYHMRKEQNQRGQGTDEPLQEIVVAQRKYPMVRLPKAMVPRTMVIIVEMTWYQGMMCSGPPSRKPGENANKNGPI